MLHKSKRILIGIPILFFPFLSLFAQLPVNGFYPKKNTLTIAPSYAFKNFDQFYRGTTLAEGNPAGQGEITSDIINLYAQYAITDWLSGTVTLPYINVISEDNIPDPVQEVTEVDDLQDLGIYLKSRITEKKFEDNSRFTLGGAAGVSFPVSDYEGAGVLSIGNQATTVNGSVLALYSLPFNIFTEVQLGYSYRDSDDFDIPNAMLYSAKIGYHNEFIYLHAQLDIQDSMSGFDIGTPEFAEAGAAAILPETEVDYTNLRFDFYVPVYKNSIGLSAGYGVTLNGRNFSKEEAFSFGLVYNAY
ncbi:hypothetical protein [Aquimarina algicola]|uniref:Uncharacterized protein n=1 Tax=Aquimarina algicola TaxID=2589995 RepID=A0A504J0J1_9FLAO|nr:hypothetical protein [Aquimarina algicola]TPN83924.1 hypothetical protein FHK87_18340 [Aquimarina algicola]